MTAHTALFRTDASPDIGSGHVIRCLTLAESLREAGTNCRFACRDHPGNLVEAIRRRGFEVNVLAFDKGWACAPDSGSAHAAWLGADWQTDSELTRAGVTAIDWLIVYHYALDARWEAALRPYCGGIMVIDDIADRRHACDLLLDQNLGRQAEDYASLTPPGCTLLVGSQYALLRPDFAALRPFSLNRRNESQLKHVLIAMGGVDKDDVTGTVLDTLRTYPLPADCRLSIVLGPHAPWLGQVRVKAASMPWPAEVLVNISDMARLMAYCDLAIGAGGSSSWARCCLGLPTLMLVLADNQRGVAQALQEAGAAGLIGEPEAIVDHLPELMNTIRELDTLQRMSAVAAALCDGQGTGLVVEHLAGIAA